MRTGDEQALVKLPGIGKKSAQRLVVELGTATTGLGPGRPIRVRRRAPERTGRLNEAAAVLQAMGLTAAAAEQALSRARRNDPTLGEDLEAWVRAALRGV